MQDVSGSVAESASVPAPSSSNKAIIKQNHFDGGGCNVGTLRAVSQEIEVGMNRKEKPSGLETPPGSFLGQ